MLVLRTLQKTPHPLLEEMLIIIVKLIAESQEVSPGGVTNLMHTPSLHRLDSSSGDLENEGKSGLDISIQNSITKVSEMRLDVLKRIVLSLVSAIVMYVAAIFSN